VYRLIAKVEFFGTNENRTERRISFLQIFSEVKKIIAGGVKAISVKISSMQRKQFGLHQGHMYPCVV
jgi:hypothetical protein